MFKYIGIVSIGLALFACKTKKDATASSENENATTIYTIRHGSNYGHCRGYCIHDQTYTSFSVTTLDESRDTVNYKPKTWNESDKTTMKQAEAMVNWEIWNKLEEKLGCPDCADGGAEYIEIITKKGAKRVTFDGSASIPGLEPLVDLLRKRSMELDKHKAKEQQE